MSQKALTTPATTNVKVAVRCRPFNKREIGLGCESVIEIENGTEVFVSNPKGAGSGSNAGTSGGSAKPQQFTFDHAYWMDSTQKQVYNDLAEPIVEKAMAGYNGTIFAYGQTGSGKTYSMMGGDNDPGIIPMLNEALFARISKAQEENPEIKFLVIVSYLEIYNEVLKDLLNPSDRKLDIAEHPQEGVFVKGLAEIVVKGPEDVQRLIDQGQKVRHVAATAMNERSSRSHSCFTIKIEQKTVEKTEEKEKTTTLTAKINLVDLAGSERVSKTGAEGQRLKEGAAINKSLSALGNVINALSEGRGHIPYRDSRLTRLLQHSLGGNSLSVMIAAISPASDNLDETVSTLHYASRAKRIKNMAKRNEDVNEQLIRQLREEIDALRKALAEAQALQEANRGGVHTGGSEVGGTGALSIAAKEAMEEKLAALERAKQASWEEKERLSKLFEEQRASVLSNEKRVASLMATIKEDNMELMKRIRALMAEKARLLRQFKTEREGHMKTRESLTAKMSKYQELFDLDGTDQGPHKEEMERIMAQIEQLRLQAESESESLQRLRDFIKENEEKLAEERAEAAAQRALLEGDAELRKAIAEEERAKLEENNANLLEARIEAERRKIKEDAEREKAELLQKYKGRGADREAELQVSLIELQSEKGSLMLEMGKIKAEAEAQVRSLKAEHQKTISQLKIEELRMFREMAMGYEEERQGLLRKISELSKLLSSALKDIEYLAARNAQLESAFQ